MCISTFSPGTFKTFSTVTFYNSSGHSLFSELFFVLETCFGSMKYTNYSVDMPASVMHLLRWKADVWKNFSWKNKKISTTEINDGNQHLWGVFVRILTVK